MMNIYQKSYMEKRFKAEELYICKMSFPIGDKCYRVVGLGGEVQDAFFRLFKSDMLLLRNKDEVDDALKKVIADLNR